MFTFAKLHYTDTRGGVDVRGDVLRDGSKVGTFEQRAGAACLVFIDDSVARAEFKALASQSDPEEFAEHLLYQAEEVLLNRSK